MLTKKIPARLFLKPAGRPVDWSVYAGFAGATWEAIVRLIGYVV